MPITGNQLYLNNPLSYDSTVTTLPNAKHIMDKATGDGLVDLHRSRYYVVPSAQINGSNTTFTLPENALSGGVRVFRNGLEENHANVTQPTAAQVQLATAPAGPSNPERVEIVYYPSSGLTSNFSDRLQVTTKTAGTTLTKSELADGILVLNLVEDSLFILPAGSDHYDDGLNFVVYLHTPSYRARFRASGADTINTRDAEFELDSSNRSGKMIYQWQHRDWVMPRKRLVSGTSFSPFPTQTNSWLPISEES